jgi:hypothetical protein
MKRYCGYALVFPILFLSVVSLSCARTPDSPEQSLHLSTDTPPTEKEIHEKLSDSDDLDGFLTWLEAQPGIQDVNVDRQLFFTTAPPQVAVTFSQNGVRRKLLVAIQPESKLKLARPE